MYNGALADMGLGMDPYTGNRYAFTGGNPVNFLELDGHQMAPAGGGGANPTLAAVTLANGLTAIYDAYGFGHVVATAADNSASKLALQALNDDLKAAGVYSDGSNKGTGEIYLPQDDTNRLTDKGSFTDSSGNLRMRGTTADLIRVSYDQGKIVDVVEFDVTSSSDRASLNNIANSIKNKMDPARKSQTNNVIYVSSSVRQAQDVANHFSGDARVRVIHPGSGFDTGQVFNGVSGRANASRVSPKLRGRVFGAAGFLMPLAQSNSYVRSFGFWGGLAEMGKDIFDPFGFHEAVEPSRGSPEYI
jgi:hypothetical protein